MGNTPLPRNACTYERGARDTHLFQLVDRIHQVPRRDVPRLRVLVVSVLEASPTMAISAAPLALRHASGARSERGETEETSETRGEGRRGRRKPSEQASTRPNERRGEAIAVRSSVRGRPWRRGRSPVPHFPRRLASVADSCESGGRARNGTSRVRARAVSRRAMAARGLTLTCDPLKLCRPLVMD